VRVAVTGNVGQVVSALIELAKDGPFEVVALGRPELDLADVNSIEPAIRAARADVVVSAAAYTAVDKAEGEADLAFAINATGAGELARVAHEMMIPIIHISTDYVFDGSKAEPYASWRCDLADGLGLFALWREFCKDYAASC